MKILFKPAVLIIILLFAVLFSCGKEAPFFDGSQAFEYLTAQTDFGPRNPGSEGAAKCLSYLHDELSKYADRIIKQPFTFTDENTDSTYNMTNIIASFNLSPANGKRILLMAHWDTRPRADKDPDPEKRGTPIIGANDGASGVAVLLQAARMFKENPPPVGVDILLLDGEDYGESGNLDYYCLGAKHFVNNIGGYKPVYAILLDMVGDKDLRFPMEGNSLQYARSVTERIWNVADEFGLSAFVKEPGATIYDDHVVFNRAGIPAVDIIDFDYPYWHTVSDTPDKCSAESLAQAGAIIIAMIYE